MFKLGLSLSLFIIGVTILGCSSTFDLTSSEQSLETILSDFQAITNKLDSFTKQTGEKIDKKTVLAQSLLNEVTIHKAEVDRAHIVSHNIEKLVGISK